mgnify:CR=1 FL=1
MIPFPDGFSLEALRAILVAYGLLAPFVLGIAEEVLFFIPSALLFLGMGFLLVSSGASSGSALTVAFGQIALPATFGVTIGAGLMYAIAYFGGRPAIVRFGRHIGISFDDVSRIGRFFGKQGYPDEAVLIFLRAIPIFPISVVSAFSGIVRVPPLPFFGTTFIGSFIRIGALSFLGWYAGKGHIALAGHLAAFEGVVAALIVVAFLLFLRFRRRSLHSAAGPR